MRQVEEQLVVLSDTAFHAAEGDPSNLTLCQRGAWEDRILVGGDSAVDADARLPFQKGDAPYVGLFPSTARVHHGRL